METIMRRLGFAGFALLALACSLSGQARAGPSARSFYVQGGFDDSGHSLSDLERYTATWNAAMRSAGLPTGFDDVGWAPGFEVEAGYHVTDVLSIGVGFSHGMHSTDGSSAGVLDPGGRPIALRYTRKLEASISEFTANVTYSVPAIRGIFLGAQVGLALGTLDEDVSAVATDGINVESDSWSGEFTGSGLAGGVFGGYRMGLGAGFSTFGKLGYHSRNLGRFRGHFTRNGEPEPSGDHDYAGLLNALDPEAYPFRAVEFNYSGPYFSLGLGVSFGGR
jgi:hypothetical protein